MSDDITDSSDLETEDGSSPEGDSSGKGSGAKKPQDSGGCGLTCLVLIGYLLFFAFSIAIAMVLINLAQA